MKNLILLLLLSGFFSQSILATALAPDLNSSLYEHLVEVNQLWLKADVSALDLSQSISFEHDDDRIQQHLIFVEELLRLKEHPNLTEKQIEKRQHHLNVLVKYFSIKQFPINSYHNERQPYFVDKFGTACAVGYLLLEDGQYEFVQKIVDGNNYAYVMEMNYPEIEIWAVENGFTKEELALIQPGYPPQPRDFSPVGQNLGVDGNINKLLTSHDGELLFMCGDFDVVDGNDGYNSIAAWDGEEWQKLGLGVEGEVLDMTKDVYGNLFVVGDFSNPNSVNQKNIAIWNGENWDWPQEGDMDGIIHTVFATHPDNIYVGGDYNMIGGQPISYIARTANDGSGWYNSGGTLTLDGPVYKIEKVGENLLLGGDFSQTYPDGIEPNINQLEVKNLAYWNNWNWVGGFNEEAIGVVNTIDYVNGNLYVAGPLDDGSYYSFLEAGLWNHLDENYIVMDSLESSHFIGGYIEWEDRVYMYGGFMYYPFVGTFGNGLVDVTNVYTDGVADFQGGGVRAAAIYQDELYFAGDFNVISGGWSGPNISLNNITKTTLSPITSIDAIEDEEHVKVYYANQMLNIEYQQLNQDALLTIYDITGKAIHKVNLTLGSQSSNIDLSDLPKGAYVVSIQSEGMLQSEMIAVY